MFQIKVVDVNEVHILYYEQKTIFEEIDEVRLELQVKYG